MVEKKSTSGFITSLILVSKLVGKVAPAIVTLIWSTSNIESVSQVSMAEAERGVDILFTPEITACPELPNCRRNASVSSLGGNFT